MGKTNSRSSGPRYSKPEDRPTRDPLPGPGPFRARLAQAGLKTFAPVQPMSVTYDLGDPVGRANRLRAMTGCKKCGKMPTFTQVHLELRNQIQVLCKHHTGSTARVVFYSFCCRQPCEWSAKAIHALQLVLEGEAA